MRTLTIAILILAASLPPSFAANATSLVELLEQGKVKLQPVGLGGHSGDCLRVDVHNASSTAISTSIPPGWIFVSESNSVQDLLVVREEVLALQPGAN